jgi:threonine aldolase
LTDDIILESILGGPDVRWFGHEPISTEERRMRPIDLRSDTKTLPSQEMRKAMFEAEVGDDESGEDPTVNRLQEYSAGLFGKEAALFFPTGTMANHVGLRALTNPSEVIFLHARSYIELYSMGASAALCGLQAHCFDSPDGTLDPAEMEPWVQTDENETDAVTRAVVLENTHNACGGLIYPLEKIRDVRAFCDRHGMRLHLDGARIFNASVATGKPVAEIAALCDTVSFCLSKGLGAPVGSVLVGDSTVVRRALRYRAQFGGAMRQAGIVAAAGLYALGHNVNRLADDHRRARHLASLLARIEGLAVDTSRVQTNMVLADTTPSGRSADEVTESLVEQGVLADPNPYGIRFVTHLHIDDEGVERAADSVSRVMERLIA